MKDYLISYTHTLGACSMMVYSWEVASVLMNMALMAIDGHQFSNVTLKRL